MDNKTSKPLPFGTLGVHKVRFFFPGFLLFLMGREGFMNMKLFF